MIKRLLSKDATITIATVQFFIYAIFCMTAFVGWIWSIYSPLPQGYITRHLIRWTDKFPNWGSTIVVAGVLSFIAAYLLWRSKKLGACLGVLSFLIGFATNLIIARNLFVHTLVGLLIGWTLLVPLFAGWKSLKNFF